MEEDRFIINNGDQEQQDVITIYIQLEKDSVPSYGPSH